MAPAASVAERSWLRGVSLGMQAALGLREAGPATRAGIFTRLDGAGAVCASDGRVSLIVQRVVGNVMPLDIGPDILRRPTRQGIEFDQFKLRVPVDDLRSRATRGLFATNAGDPGLIRLQGPRQGGDFSLVTALVRLPLPQLVAELSALLLRREHGLHLDRRDAVFLHESIAGGIGLRKQKVRVEIEDRSKRIEAMDHVNQHDIFGPKAARQDNIRKIGGKRRSQDFLGRLALHLMVEMLKPLEIGRGGRRHYPTFSTVTLKKFSEAISDMTFWPSLRRDCGTFRMGSPASNHTSRIWPSSIISSFSLVLT